MRYTHTKQSNKKRAGYGHDSQHVIIDFLLEDIKNTKKVITSIRVLQELWWEGDRTQGHIKETAYIQETKVLIQQKSHDYQNE